ncbi:hypothetical protein LCGC14_0718120 [marine sediment metagenome]|uniref:GIY-YIG domain-containing protein n=1 Tax=marine sediment metagenome TaxID=412755 RepID=A0A0F9QD80_9ZZZZ
MIIYAIEHIETGRRYIGQTIAESAFHWNQYRSNLERNKFHNKHLQNAWNRDGIDAFRFIIVDTSAKNQNELNSLETIYVATQGYYNVVPGGNPNGKNRPWLGKKFSQQHKDRISKSTKEGMAKWKIQYSKKLKGERNPFSKLTTRQAMEIKFLRRFGWKLIHLSQIYGIGITTVCAICTGRSWKHLPKV